MSRFEINDSKSILVRHERVTLGVRKPVRLLYASDLHLMGQPRSHRVADQLVEAVATTLPHAVLLGGDLADSAPGIALLEATTRRLATVCPVLAIPGNHDYRTGIDSVKRAICAGGGRWLPDGDQSIASFRVDGVLDAQENLLLTKILCTHNPAVFPAARAAGYALVFAGHLHGGQCVFWQRQARLYPGAYVFRWNGLRFRAGPTTMLVSRGVSDLLPVRWNCPREVIVCDIC